MALFRTLPVGDKCPTTTTDLDKKSKEMNCTKEFGPARYHCLRNEKGQLGTLCVEPSWIQKEYCPEYNEVAKRMDAEKCNKTLGVCPGNTFLSSNVISYSACIYTKDKVFTSTYQAGIQPNSTVTPESTAKTSTSFIVLVISVTLLVLVLVVSLIVLLSFQLKRRKRQRKGISQESHELLPTPDDVVYPCPSRLEDEEPGPEVIDFRKNVKYYDYGRKKSDTILFVEGWIILRGITGCGKTTMGLNTLSLYHNHGLNGRKCKTRVINTIDGLSDRFLEINPKATYILLVDDICERWEYMPDIVDKDLRKLKVFYERALNEKHDVRHVYAIFTVSYRIWSMYPEKFKHHVVLNNEHVVDLHEKSYVFRTDDILKLLSTKLGICDSKPNEEDLNVETKIKQHNFEPDQLKQLADSLRKQNQIGAHVLIELFSQSSYMKNNVKTFMENPEKCILDMLTEMHGLDVQQYSALVYLMLKGGRVPLKEDEDYELIEELNKAGFPVQKGECMAVMKKSELVREHNDSYISFRHEIILLYMFRHFTQDLARNRLSKPVTGNPAFFIKHCDPSMLLKFVRTKISSRETDKFVLKTESIENIAQRLAEHYTRSGDETIYDHILLSDEKLKKEFENELQKQKYKNKPADC